MKAIIKLDVPEWQIGQEVTVHFPDTMVKHEKCELLKEQKKTGHWEMKADPFGFFDEIPVCSECGCTNAMRKKTEFCEHCGADMREGDGDG